MKKEMAVAESERVPQIDTIIILDRQIDLISPLITQLTYEGLIDEFFGIKNSTVKLPGNKFQPAESEEGTDAQSSTNSTKQFPLNSSEELYSELRDKNFNAVGPILSRKARIISAAMEEMRVGKSVQDLKAFVMEKIPQMKSLKQSVTIHTSIAELVKEKIPQMKSLKQSVTIHTSIA